MNGHFDTFSCIRHGLIGWRKNLNKSILANTKQSPPTFSFLCNNSQAPSKVIFANIRLCDHETKVEHELLIESIVPLAFGTVQMKAM